jgi:hypothetical protein
MQGKLFIGVAALAVSTTALAGEPVKRPVCTKEQAQQRQPQQAQQQRAKTPECRTSRTIPPVVDPTPWFLL